MLGKIKGFGRLCQHWSDCPEGQYCIQGLCSCNSGQVLSNNRCVQNNYCLEDKMVFHNNRCYYVRLFGEWCSINEQCYGESLCIDGRCNCTQGLVPRLTNFEDMVIAIFVCQRQNPNRIRCNQKQVLVDGQCLDIIPIGGTCLVDAQCSGGANCGNKQCTCPDGTEQSGEICTRLNCFENEVPINGTCMKLMPPGHQCQNSAQCLDGSQCSITKHFCECPEEMDSIYNYCRKISFNDPCDYISTVYVNGKCMEITEPGGKCQYDSQCLGGSTCKDGYCKCPAAITTLIGNAYCVGLAKCDHEEILVNNRCFKKAHFNETCSVSEQCPDTTVCNYAAKCVCPSGTRVNGRCMMIRSVGSTCEVDEQCFDESMRCLDGYCTCPSNTILVSGYCARYNATGTCGPHHIYLNGQCLILAEAGDDCIADLQCLAGSTCLAGKCECSTGYKKVNNYCVLNAELSTKCDFNQVPFNGHCYMRAGIGQYCIDTSICLGGSICSNSSCICPQGSFARKRRCQREKPCPNRQIEVHGQCYPMVNINEHCQFTEQCTSISHCENGICTCPLDIISVDNTCRSPCRSGQVYLAEKCWNIAYIDQPCKFTDQCQHNSTCVAGICRCPLGTVERDGQCIREIQCKSNEVMIDNMCYKLVSAGEFCYHNEQCQGNAECHNNMCVCPWSTVKFNEKCITKPICHPDQVLIDDLCFDIVSIGMNCRSNAQCIESASCVLGTNSSSKTCQCNHGTVFTGSKCVASSFRCPLSTVFVDKDSCEPLVKIGESCMHSSQCMGFSVCSNHSCKCPTGYTAGYADIRTICKKWDWLV